MAGDRKQGINKCWPKLGPATYVLFAMYKKCSYKSSEASYMYALLYTQKVPDYRYKGLFTSTIQSKRYSKNCNHASHVAT